MVAGVPAKRGLWFYLNAWVLAARPMTLTAAVVPVLLGTVLAMAEDYLDWLLFAFAFAGSVLIQVGTNLADEYTDHRGKAGATKYPAPHKVIARGLLSERAVLYGLIASFSLSTAMGLYIVSQVGWPILVVGLLSTVAGYAHSSGPFPLGHYLLGELTVFVFMGPLIVMAAFYVQAQYVTWDVFWASAPVALLVTAILQCNNLRDRVDDRAEGKHTFATVLPLAVGWRVYAALVAGAFAALVAIVVAGVVSWLALAALATLPAAYAQVQRLRTVRERPQYNVALVGSARLHMHAGLLMTAGIVVDTLLHTL